MTAVPSPAPGPPAPAPTPGSPFAEREAEQYRVALDVFSGPLDLLLHLIREDELAVERIPVSRIADQYVAWIESVEGLDLGLMADFLVLAATLLELKSRALLPAAPAGEDGDEVGPDPRLELVRKLLEYRRYKGLARALERLAEARALRWARAAPLGFPEEPPGGLALEELSLDDLRLHFARVSSETMLGRTRALLLDEMPLGEYLDRIRAALDARGTVLLRELCPTGATRPMLVGTFVALLELIRQGAVGAEQGEPFGDVRIFPRTDEPPAPGAADPGQAPAPPEPPPSPAPSSEPDDPSV